MHQTIIDQTVGEIISRCLADGSFRLYAEGNPRPDSTAWAAIALSMAQRNGEHSSRACRYLTSIQQRDGRVPLEPDTPEAYWPTSLAIWAWKINDGFENERQNAVSFLLDLTGEHSKKNKKQARTIGHDTTLKGWPWIEGTHSWIEPTALAIIALKICGKENHERVSEAKKMIIDRQLPTGGWNYGNPSVFGQTLLAMPDSTGHALAALAGLVEKAAVLRSIDYLLDAIRYLKTPQAYCWSLFGLSAWSVETSVYKDKDRLIEILRLQNTYGPFDTSLLSKLLVAYFSGGSLLKIFA
jgi:hypothetical protein